MERNETLSRTEVSRYKTLETRRCLPWMKRRWSRMRQKSNGSRMGVSSGRHRRLASTRFLLSHTVRASCLYSYSRVHGYTRLARHTWQGHTYRKARNADCQRRCSADLLYDYHSLQPDRRCRCVCVNQRCQLYLLEERRTRRGDVIK